MVVSMVMGGAPADMDKREEQMREASEYIKERKREEAIRNRESDGENDGHDLDTDTDDTHYCLACGHTKHIQTPYGRTDSFCTDCDDLRTFKRIEDDD